MGDRGEGKITTGTNGKTPGQWVHPTTHQQHWAQQSSHLNIQTNLAITLPSVTLPDDNSEGDNEEPKELIKNSEAECIYLLLYFLVWLAQDWLIYIIKEFQQLPPGPDSYLCSQKYIQKITKQLRLEPNIDSQICCPSCFTLSPVCEEAIFTPLPTTIPLIYPLLSIPYPRLCKVEVVCEFKSTASSDVVDIQQLRAWKRFSLRTDNFFAINFNTFFQCTLTGLIHLGTSFLTPGFNGSSGPDCLLSSSEVLHKALGHVSYRRIQQRLGIPLKNYSSCKACAVSKVIKGSFHTQHSKASKPFEEIHLDISEVGTCLTQAIDLEARQIGYYPTLIHSDRGTEFINKYLLDFCNKNLICARYSNAYTPQQNGLAESEIIKSSTLTLNQIPSHKSKKSLFELFKNRSLPLNYFKPIGLRVDFRDLSENTNSKLAQICKLGRILGYNDELQSYKILTDDGKIVNSKHLKFLDFNVSFSSDEGNITIDEETDCEDLSGEILYVVDGSFDEIPSNSMNESVCNEVEEIEDVKDDENLFSNPLRLKAERRHDEITRREPGRDRRGGTVCPKTTRHVSEN
ncbi:hypothetical protein VP01_767g2 [Puccinia sorghi]|uniref:Integrase catalytic domain-containing protein n=1 Tax=Puccinia sorghi TaxID=27349 RepID=A0A0L6UBR8_9BASI|nr:hypothetical protein VP01_767g2 [Puccinia sorghi]